MLDTVANMKKGQQAIVSHIIGGRHREAKLESLGIRKGVKITKKSSLPIKGPAIVGVGNTEIAIGYRMTTFIFVEVE